MCQGKGQIIKGPRKIQNSHKNIQYRDCTEDQRKKKGIRLILGRLKLKLDLVWFVMSGVYYFLALRKKAFIESNLANSAVELYFLYLWFCIKYKIKMR